MLRKLYPGLLLTILVACTDPTGPCRPGALCIRQPPLVATGRVQASAQPIPGAVVTLTAYSDTCGGSPAVILPSPAVDTADQAGRYSIGVFPVDSVVAACVRVTYSPALFADTTGVVLDPYATGSDTLRINLVGP